MRDYIIRTLVPLIVGVIVGQAARIGLELDPVAVTTIVTPAATLAYAYAARLLEQHIPAARVLLGLGLARRTPTYETPVR